MILVAVFDFMKIFSPLLLFFDKMSSGYGRYKRKGNYKRYYKKKYAGKYSKTTAAMNRYAGYARKRMLGFIPADGLKPELKFVDDSGPDLEPIVAGSGALLNGVAPGSAFYNRIGRRINMKSIELRAFWLRNTGDNATPQYTRCLLVYDRQANGATPTWADIITSYDVAGTADVGPNAYPNPQNKSRFRILWDWQYIFPATTGATSLDAGFDQNQFVGVGRDNGNIHKYIKLDKMETIFKGSDGLIGSIATGALWLFTASTKAAAPSAYSLRWSCRLTFVDV